MRSAVSIKAVLVAIGLALVTAAAGCASIDYRAHMLTQERVMGPSLPRINVDVPASSMVLSYVAGADGSFDRDSVLRGFEDYWNSCAAGSDAVPAKITINGVLSDNYLWLALYGGIFSIYGVPTMSSSADLQIEVTTPVTSYRSNGSGSCYAGAFYPGDPAQCAFSKALTEAVRQLAMRL